MSIFWKQVCFTCDYPEKRVRNLSSSLSIIGTVRPFLDLCLVLFINGHELSSVYSRRSNWDLYKDLFQLLPNHPAH